MATQKYRRNLRRSANRPPGPRARAVSRGKRSSRRLSLVQEITTGTFYMDHYEGSSKFVSSALDLQGYVDSQVVLTDWQGRGAAGWIAGNSGASEALGSELITNGNFANWTTDDPDNWSLAAVEDVNNYVTENPAGQCQIVSLDVSMGIYQQPGWVSGKLYKFTMDVKARAVGSYNVTESGAGYLFNNHTAVGIITTYWTNVVSNQRMYIYRSIAASNFTVDDVSLKEVTDIGGTGVEIVDSKRGSYRAWRRLDNNFDPNRIEKMEIYS